MSRMDDSGRSVIRSTDLQDYFRGSVVSAMSNQGVEAGASTVGYLSELLTRFSRSESFFEHGESGPTLRPLAGVYAAALEAPSEHHRTQLLRRLGDMALFIAGVFTDSLNRRLVDVDYYVAMGGNAYSCLSDTVRGGRQGPCLSEVFEELARKFQDFVDVFGEIAEQSCPERDQDMLRLYEVWVRTGSRRAERKLRTLGLIPASANVSRAHH